VINDIQSAKAALPSEYRRVDDDFLRDYAKPISVLKEHYAASGGLEVITVDEYSVICRVPTKQILTDVMANSNKMSGIDSDIFLVVQCLVYPSGQQFRNWIDSGAPGLAASVARALMAASKANTEAVRKKL
jgi:hypothetical protein